MAKRKDTSTPAPVAPAPKKARRSKAPAKAAVDDSSDIEVAENGRAPRKQVNWVRNPHWTDKLVEFLSENPTFRIKLFSDSTADAKKEARAKQVAKDGKAVQCGMLAKYIFENDQQERARYANDPAKFAGAVETRLRRFVLPLLCLVFALIICIGSRKTTSASWGRLVRQGQDWIQTE
jgi:hypothetical protein